MLVEEIPIGRIAEYPRKVRHLEIGRTMFRLPDSRIIGRAYMHLHDITIHSDNADAGLR